MKLNLKNSLSLIAGFIIVLLLVEVLFGDIAYYSVWAFSFGYMLGDAGGFSRGKESGRREAHDETVMEIENSLAHSND
jgi:hypothetical protein